MGRTPRATAGTKGPKKAPVKRPSPLPPAPLRITALRLKGFKGFESAELDLGGLTVVVGSNASGKSNLRDAFRFLHGIGRGYSLPEIIGEKWVEGGVLQWRGIRGGPNEIAHERGKSFSLEVDLVASDEERPVQFTYHVAVGMPRAGSPNAPYVLRERLTKGRHTVKIQLEHIPTPRGLWPAIAARAAGWLPLSAAINEGRLAADRVIASFASMRFFDLSPEAMRRPSLPGQVVLGDRGENLSSVLQAICADGPRKRALVEWIRALTPLDVVDLHFPADQSGRVLLSLVEENGRETSAYSASDGTLRFLAMVAAFLGPDPAGFYFFEELDTGLHPTRLHLLIGLIEKQVQKRHIQVVATTHSPPLLSYLGPEALASATLAYRLPGSTSQRLTKIARLPDVRRVLETHDIAELHATGWLENAVLLSSGPDDAETPKAAE